MELSRRRLIQAGIAGTAWGSVMRLPGFDEVFEATQADAVTPPKCLVMIYLQGGNDGLGIVNPGTGDSAGYGAYVTARTALHRGHGATGPDPIDSSKTLVGSRDIPSTDAKLAFSNVVVSSTGGGDNGSATQGLDLLYGDGSGGVGSELAILPATDYTPSNFSHFDSSDYWFAGALTGMTTGWLGRWIDNNGTTGNPLQAVSIDTSLSKAIRTAHNPVCAIPATSAGKTGTLGYSMHTTGGYDEPAGSPSPTNINAQMTAFATIGAGNPALTKDRTTYAQAVDVASSGATINGLADATGYPSTGTLSKRLKLAARILSAGVGTRVITIHWGSFDTHGNQLTGQDPQLTELSLALSAFKADLATRGFEQNVATMVFSEFGRRFAENGSGGTDHGAGGFMMLSGSQVRGGLASPFPDVSTIGTNGNLPVTTDFRSVYQSVLGEWLGGDLTGCLPGGTFPALQRHDGTHTLFR